MKFHMHICTYEYEFHTYAHMKILKEGKILQMPKQGRVTEQRGL